MLGDQHRTVDVLACGGPREQVGIGGTRFVDDIESAPRQIVPGERVPQGHRVKR